MEVSTLIQQSIVIMLVGLSIVFLFLSILILMINLSHRIILAFNLDKETKEKETNRIIKDKNIIAVISAAIDHYRQ